MTTHTTAPTSALARGPLTRWRTVDLVTAAMLGVAFGVAYWGWAAAYNVLSPLFTAVPAIGGVLGGPWLIAGVVGGLVVRRPGAAVLAEVLAAQVEALLGNQWGQLSTLVAGLLQGLGVEIVLAVVLYRRFGPWIAAACGVGAAVLETIYEYGAYDYGTTFGAGGTLVYFLSFAISAAIVAGLGGWLLVRALARTGALASFPPGRERALEADQALGLDELGSRRRAA